MSTQSIRRMPILIFCLALCLPALLAPSAGAALPSDSLGTEGEFPPGTLSAPDGPFSSESFPLGSGRALPERARTRPQDSIIPGRYIVVFKDSVKGPAAVARAQTRQRGGELGFVYRHAVKGYSAQLSKGAVEALRRDPRVKYVSPDREVEVAAQVTPTGIERIYATQSKIADIDEKDDVRVDVDVAVIDTGIYQHSDLNVVGGTNCVPDGEGPIACVNEAGVDGHGHGTHVAGTIGALDNTFGVVGVAPGARLWGVRVLNNSGSGSFAWVIAGVDWVTATRKDEDPENDIDVANMSIGCGSLPCVNPALDEALSKSAEAGVVYAVAAGNNAGDAKQSTFGTNPDVITVSALEDYDGEPGGNSLPTCRTYGQDDTLASFSNFGEDIEVAAPGVCIRSTWKNDEYRTLSGTSMASPHVAGVAAIHASEASPENLEDVAAIRQAIEDDGNFEWTDDSGDGVQEPLADVGRIVTEPAAVDSESEVTLHGRVRPGGLETTYHFEYGESTEYGTSVPISGEEIGSGAGYVHVSKPVAGLEGQTTYHVRLVASNAEETLYGEDRVFGTTPPTATTDAATDINPNDATMNATVNPEGVPTGYHFEYGLTTSYGRSTPVLFKDIGSGTEDIPVEAGAGVLADGQTYHYRVVAKSAAGIAYGEDETFTTATPAQWTGERVEQPNPNPRPSPTLGENFRHRLDAVSCVARDSCMAIANFTNYLGQAESMQWDGESWTAATMAAPENASTTLLVDVSCVSDDWCVAVGYGNLLTAEGWEGRPVIQHWDGNGWTDTAVPLPEGVHTESVNGSPLTSVSCATKNACMAVGWYPAPPRSPLIYSWDGEEWSLAEMPTPPNSAAGAHARAVDCPSPSWCMVGGGTRKDVTGGLAPFAEVWDGEEWTVLPDVITDFARDIKDVSCTKPDECAALFSYVGTRPSPRVGRWDGTEWDLEVLPPTIGTDDVVGGGISCPAADACTLVGLVWIENGLAPTAFAWNGSTWSGQSTSVPMEGEEGSAIPGTYLSGVSCWSPSGCIAVGGDLPYKGERAGIAEFYQAPGPISDTEPATNLGWTTATLNGVVDPQSLETAYQFEYGTSTEYGTKVPASPEGIGSGGEAIEVSRALKGLKPDTTYHFRVVATNANGTTYGENMTFTTGSPPYFVFSVGENGTGEGQFDEPLGIATDGEGNVWVADSENSRIVKFDAEGQFLFQVGAEGTAAGQFGPNSPYSIVVDAEGNLWAADTFNDRIQKFNSEGEFIKAFGWGVLNGESKAQVCEASCQKGLSGKGAGQLYRPYGIEIDADGDIWVADTWNSRVQKFDTDGSPLTQLESPSTVVATDVAADSDGNLWVAQYAKDQVVKLSPEGELLLQIDAEGSGDGELDMPTGVDVDADDNVWVADSENNRIQVFNSAGKYLIQLGEEGAGDGQFVFPRAVAFAPDGDAWIVDSYNSRIQKWSFPRQPHATTDPATELSTEAATLNATVNPNGAATDYQFEYGTTTEYGSKAPASPEGIGSGTEAVEVDEAIEGLEPGTTYHFRVVATNAKGTTHGKDRTFTTHEPPPALAFSFGSQGYGEGELNYPHGIAIDTEGDIWVADTENNLVQKFSPEGEYLNQFGPGFSEEEFGSLTSGDGEFESPQGIAIDTEGDIWVADAGNNRVQKFNPEGEYLAQFGSPGSGDGEFNYPQGIAIDTEGDIWVADALNNRIQKFNPEGEYLAQFGSPGSGNGEFNYPQRIAIDTEGDIWVADTGNNRVQKFNPEGEYLAQFGSQGSGDGQFQSPVGIAGDSEGNLWVADTGNSRVQMFNPEGEYLAQFGSQGSGDGEFESPHGIAIDTEGDIWIADSYNHRVQKWTYRPLATTDPASELSTASATLNATVNPRGLATTYQFEYGTTTEYGSKAPASPEGIGSGTEALEVDEAIEGLEPGTTYHFRVVASNAKGTTHGKDRTFTTHEPPPAFALAFGSQGSGEGQFSEHIHDAATDAEGNVYVLDPYQDRIQKFSSAGEYLSQITSPGSGGGNFYYPSAIEIDAEGDLWLLEKNNQRVLRLSPEGDYLSQFEVSYQGGEELEPGTMTIDPAGDIWLGRDGNVVEKFNQEGESLTEFGSYGSGDGEFKWARGLATDSEGNVWVADYGNHRIQKFNPEGEYLAQFGSKGTGHGQFEGPSGIEIDPKGNIWIAEAGNSRVQMFNPEGEYLTQFGSFGTGDGELKWPSGITGGVNGDIWIVDTGNVRMHRWTYSGPVVNTDAATNVSTAGATLNATINPRGLATTYQFEYGKTTAYGSNVPAEPKGIGSGTEAVEVEEEIGGLASGTTYHYRVVATNENGTAYGKDRTFETEEE